MNKVQTLKGFRDFLPEQARKRQYVIDKLKAVFESYGFEPLETPALEYENILLGKYGEEGDKLMYRFTDGGGRKVALRYDQTVPLSRVVAQYKNGLPLPFKRYQVQPVWRAENTQKGRFREFFQCDIDTVGTTSSLSDAEIIATTVDAYSKLGFSNIKVVINDRKVFSNLSIEAITIIDKLKKIGEKGVLDRLVEKGIAKDTSVAKTMLNTIINQRPTEWLMDVIKDAEKLGVSTANIEFSPTLARGLDYYTSTIFEIESSDYPYGSLAGGGRYDTLIGMFSNSDIPAVGLAFGFDRMLEAMETLNLFPKDLNKTKILVTIFSPEFKNESLEVSSRLRSNGISTELYLGETAKIEKQLKYADQKKIPFVIIIGPDEAKTNTLTLRNMKTGEQKQVSFDELVKSLS